MGVYYKIACDDLQETIDPGDINNLGIKRGAIAHPSHPFGPVAVFAMVGRWSSYKCRIVADEGDETAYYDYKDVTREVVDDYNETYARAEGFEPLRFTGTPRRGG